MRLLADLIARCQALGKRQMIAVIGGFQSAGSISLHNRMGFETAGVLRSAGFKLGDWTDSVLTQAVQLRQRPPPELLHCIISGGAAIDRAANNFCIPASKNFSI